MYQRAFIGLMLSPTVSVFSEDKDCWIRIAKPLYILVFICSSAWLQLTIFIHTYNVPYSIGKPWYYKILFHYIFLMLMLMFDVSVNWILPLQCKDWPIKKMTTYEFGYFITIFGHFFANYIYISHKTEVLMVILMG